MRHLSTPSTFVLSLGLLGGCVTSTGTPTLDKDALREAKADDIPESRVCEALGVHPSCDACQVAGWYADEECDLFCQGFDQQCNAPGVETTEPPAGWVSPFVWVRAWWGLRDTPGHHRMGAYDRLTFDSRELALSIRRFDAEVRGCEERSYSHSREDGVAKYEAFTSSTSVFPDPEDYDVRRTAEQVASPDNRAVYASIPRDGDRSPECQYGDFYVFRADGTAIHLGFELGSTSREHAVAAGPDGVRWIDETDLHAVRRMDHYGHNGSSSLGVWLGEPTYEELVHAVRYHASNRYGCDDRGVSQNSAAALERYARFHRDLFGMHWYFSSAEELEDEFEDFRGDQALISSVVNDPSNVAVVSSEFMNERNGDYSEGCLIYDFFVLRENGALMRLSVNQTD